MSAWGTTDHSQRPLLSLNQDRAPLTTHLANGNQFGPRSKARDNWDRDFLEGRRNMMTKYNHNCCSRLFHGARSPESTFQLSRKDPLKLHIHPEGWLSLCACVQRDRLGLRDLERYSFDSSWNGANSPVCHTWREVLTLCRRSSTCFVLVVQSLSLTFCNPVGGSTLAFLCFTISCNLLKLILMESVKPSNHLVLCCPLFLLPSIFAASKSFPMSWLFASIRIFSNESALPTRGRKYWWFSFSISPSKEYSGLISFRIDWFDLLSVQCTLKSLHQHHSSKASMLQHSAFFMIQLSLPSITTGKNMVLTICIFAGKVMSQLFIVYRFVIALSLFICCVGFFFYSFFPKEQVSFNIMPSVTICSDFGAQENNACHCFHCFLIYLPWSDGTRCHDLIFECWVLSQLFHSPLSPSSRGSLVPLGFLPWGWCYLHIELIDISPSNLDSSLCFIQLHILHDVLA